MIPFQTVQEVENRLGRNLTYPETVWFNYSANKHDFWLYGHSILFVLLAYAVALIPLVLMEHKTFQFLSKYKIQPKVRIPLSTAWKCFRDATKVFIFVLTPLQLSSYPFYKFIGIRTGLPLPSRWEVLIHIIVYLVVEDYLNYWCHRFLHTEWAYKYIHRIHHEFPAPVAVTASHAHWLEVLLLALPWIAGPALAPGHVITFVIWVTLRQIENLDAHSGYDFPMNPTNYIPFYGGAEFHDYHHFVGKECSNNFASIFTYCDHIYGTDKGYRFYKKQLTKIKEKLKGTEQNGEVYIDNEDQKYKRM